MIEPTSAEKRAGYGGDLAVAVAQAHGVSSLFTLSGAHVFPMYDGAVEADPPMRLVDVRHEATAVFAAEATGKLTRRPGLAVLTAGPGVTNAVSPIAQAYFAGSRPAGHRREGAHDAVGQRVVAGARPPASPRAGLQAVRHRPRRVRDRRPGRRGVDHSIVTAPRAAVITNGMGRGVIPRGHPSLVTKARSVALGQCDLAVVVGTPLDFRLGYGSFGDKQQAPRAQVVHIADPPPGRCRGTRPLPARLAVT